MDNNSLPKPESDDALQKPPISIINSSAAYPNTSNKNLIFLGLLAILSLGLVVFSLKFSLSSKKTAITSTPVQPSEQACTEEAKLCPDGSSVGRSGSNCEFAECPTATPVISTADWETYIDSQYNFQFQYPPELVKIADKNELAQLNQKLTENNNKATTLFSIYADEEYPYPDAVIPTLGKTFKAKYWDLSGLFEKRFEKISLNQVKETIQKEFYSPTPVFDIQLKAIMVNGKQALRYTACEMSCSQIAVIPVNGKNLTLQLYATKKMKIPEEETLDQILSTFKFIDAKGSELKANENE